MTLRIRGTGARWVDIEGPAGRVAIPLARVSRVWLVGSVLTIDSDGLATIGDCTAEEFDRLMLALAGDVEVG